MKRFLFTIAFIAAIPVVFAADVEWLNLEPENKLGKRKLSTDYLQGKVVLVCRDASFAEPVQSIWDSFSTKPFLAIGAFDTVPPGATFPVYRGAALADAPHTPLYVVNAYGKIVYRGKDDKSATQAIVGALTDLEAPRNAVMWKKYLAYELESLPAHAYIRLSDKKSKFKTEAKEYAAELKKLAAMSDMRKVVELVEFAKKAKDPMVFGDKDKMKQKKFAELVKSAAKSQKFLNLKETVKDAKLLREVKNALADVQLAAAAL